MPVHLHPHHRPPTANFAPSVFWKSLQVARCAASEARTVRKFCHLRVSRLIVLYLRSQAFLPLESSSAYPCIERSPLWRRFLADGDTIETPNTLSGRCRTPVPPIPTRVFLAPPWHPGRSEPRHLHREPPPHVDVDVPYPHSGNPSHESQELGSPTRSPCIRVSESESEYVQVSPSRSTHIASVSEV